MPPNKNKNDNLAVLGEMEIYGLLVRVCLKKIITPFKIASDQFEPQHFLPSQHLCTAI